MTLLFQNGDDDDASSVAVQSCSIFRSKAGGHDVANSDVASVGTETTNVSYSVAMQNRLFKVSMLFSGDGIKRLECQ